MIHNPERILFAWAQDEKEGALVVENSTRALARLIKTINCALNNNKKEVKLYLPTTSITASIAGLESELYVAGNLCAKDAELKATLYEMFGEAKDFGNDYLEDVFNLEDITFDESNRVITLIGSKYKLLFSGIKETECAYKFAKSNLTGSLHVPRTPINYATLDQLQYASPCELQYLSVESRKNLLKKMQSETNWYNGSLKDSRQKITINVIATSPENQASDLFDFLYQNPEILIYLYKSIDDYREEFYYSLLELTAKAYKSSSSIKEKAVGKLGIENLYNNNTKTIKSGGQFNGNQIDFSNIKNDYWDITGFGLVSMLSREEEKLFSASPLDIIVTELHTSRPGAVLYGNGVDKTFVRQPAICVKYLLDEQDNQFNWERLGQLGQNTAYATLFYVGVEYFPALMKNVYFKQLFTELLYQFTANTIKTGGNIKATVENLDFLNAGVKGLFGRKLKLFQEFSKSYLDISIENGHVVVDAARFNDEEFYTELFYRLIFTHLPSPSGTSEQYAWDVLKKLTRSEAEDLTNKVIGQMQDELEKAKNEK